MLSVVFSVTGLLHALVTTPYLLARIACRRRGVLVTLALAAPLLVLLNVLVPVVLHLWGVAIVPGSLAAAHWLLFGAAVTAAVLLDVTLVPQSVRKERKPLYAILVLAMLFLPVTCLTGRDTHKWQDLAAAVRVERSIPWLVHPLALAGYTPRSYPSAHPLLLATTQIMGHTGVDWGFYIVSVLTAAMALCSSWRLARHFARTPRETAYMAFFYCFSPVFLRYSYWATGRGLFLALLPLFLEAVLFLPRAKAILPAAGLALLLVLSHKVGAIAVVLVLLLLPLSVLVPRRCPRLLLAIAGLPLLAVAVLLAPRVALPGPAGHLVGFLRFSVVRFGWMVPLAAVGLMAPDLWCQCPHRRRLLPCLYVAFPLAYAEDMYGALIALPLIALVACDGLWAIRSAYPSFRAPIMRITIAATAALGIAILVHRAMPATPRPVREAARFLEQHDPLGPYRVVAPGMARARIQGYVSGCPRFTVERGDGSRLGFARRPAPSLRGAPRAVYRNWIRYLRSTLALSETTTHWYGKSPCVYHVVIDGESAAPPEGARLYDRDSVQVYGPPRNESEERIGIYDSRAIAVAYTGCAMHEKKIAATIAEHDRARAAGDLERVAELRAEAASGQKRLHMQGFSKAPVINILDQIKDRLPTIKAKARVSTLGSKWDKAGLDGHKDAELVDVTMALVDAFAPTERRRKDALEIQELDPIPLKQAERIDD
jgi:hypothetical protein